MNFLKRQWFLFALALALAVGFIFPHSTANVSATPGLRSGLVASVLFLMGLTVPASSFGASFRAPKAGLLALALNIVAVPAIAFVLAQWLPERLGGGLIVAAAVPCTLASALAWTRRGGGNEVVPMMVMLLTNGFCFLIAPATLTLLIGREIKVDFASQATSLATLVVLPLFAAGFLRLYRPIARWADRHKGTITHVALAGILVMVAFGAAATSLSTSAADTNAVPLGENNVTYQETSVLWIMIVGGCALVTHLLVLGAGWFIAGWLGLKRADQIAVAIAGSQKTLMVGLQISLDCGVSTLPMTLYHIGQLVSDTVFVSHVPQPQQPPTTINAEPTRQSSR